MLIALGERLIKADVAFQGLREHEARFGGDRRTVRATCIHLCRRDGRLWQAPELVCLFDALQFASLASHLYLATMARAASQAEPANQRSCGLAGP